MRAVSSHERTYSRQSVSQLQPCWMYTPRLVLRQHTIPGQELFLDLGQRTKEALVVAGIEAVDEGLEALVSFGILDINHLGIATRR